MAAITVVCSRFRSVCIFQSSRIVNVYQNRHYAKRKNSAKEKEKKANKARQAAKVESIEKIQPWVVSKVDLKITKQTRSAIASTFKAPPVDNVWEISEHKPILFNLDNILTMHRESHHPTVYNKPSAKIYASFDLDMSMGPSKTKPMDPIQGIFCYQNLFDKENEKRILAIVDDKEQQEAALKAGAIKAAGFEVLDMFKKNEVSHHDFDHIIVHEEIVPDMAPFRQYIRHHYPNKQRGNIAVDGGIRDLVYKFVNGIEFKSEKDIFEGRYAMIDIPFGKLSMSNEEIEENLKAIIKEIESHRPKNVSTPFIQSVTIWSPPSAERLCYPFWDCLTDGYDPGFHLEGYTTHYVQQKSNVL